MNNSSIIPDVFTIEPFSHLVMSYHHAKYPHNQRPAVVKGFIELEDGNKYNVVLIIDIRQDDGNFRRYLFGLNTKKYSSDSRLFEQYRRLQKKYFGVGCFLHKPIDKEFPRPVSLRFHPAGDVFSFEDDNDLLLDYRRWENGY